MFEEDENTPTCTLENSDNPFELAQHLIALANTKGGILIIGVKKNNKVIGITPESEKHKIAKIIQKYITPSISCFFYEIQEGFKIILHIKVLKSVNGTIYFINESKKEIYLRLNEQTIKANNILDKFYKYRDLNEKISVILSNEESAILNLISISNQISLTQIFKKVKINRDTLEYNLVRLLYRDLIKISLVDNSFTISLV